MSELGLVAYCAAMGFVSAATISSFYQWVTSKRPDFALAGASRWQFVLVVVMNMFAGPFIVTQKVVTGVRKHEIRAHTALAGIAVAGMWSVCSGIFYVSLLISA